MATLSIRPLHPLFGAEALDVDIAAAPAAAGAALRDAVSIHGVVLVRGQALSDAQIEAFGNGLGQPVVFASRSVTPGGAVFPVSNLDADGAILPADHPTLAQGRANQFWHTDTTYFRPRSAISVLYGRTVPPTGGDTEFCDTRIAWEKLAEGARRRLQGLTAHHSILHSRQLAGFTDWSEEDLARLGPPVPRPLVHRHDESDRTALCLASHICRIDGLSPDDGQALVNQLIADAARPDRVYVHQWRPHDLIMWDNRCTMHRARPYDSRVHARDMRSLRTIDQADA